jgi:hypothetical protein
VRASQCATSDQTLTGSSDKIKKEPNQEPMLPDFGLQLTVLSEETAGQSLSGDGQQQA